MKASRVALVAVMGVLGVSASACSGSGTVKQQAAATSATLSPSDTRSTTPTPTPTTSTKQVTASFSMPPPSTRPVPVTTAKPHYAGTTPDHCPFITADQVATVIDTNIDTVEPGAPGQGQGCSYSYTSNSFGSFSQYWVSLAYWPQVGSAGYDSVLKQLSGVHSVSGYGVKAAWSTGTLVVLTRDGGVAVIMTVLPGGATDDPAIAEKIFTVAAPHL